MPRRRPGDVEVRHSGLQDGPLVGHVKFDQLAHLRQYDQDARGLGDGAARKTGARAPGNKGDVGRRALAYDGTDVVRRPHGHRQRGHDSVLHQPVALVRRQLDGIGYQLVGADKRRQALGEPGHGTRGRDGSCRRSSHRGCHATRA